NNIIRLTVYKQPKSVGTFEYDVGIRIVANGSDWITVPKEWLSIPEALLIGKVGDIPINEHDRDDYIPIPMPIPIPNIVINWEDYLRKLKEHEIPDELTKTKVEAETKTEEKEAEKEAEKEDDKNKPPPGGVIGGFHLFPFCIPIDVIDMVKGLSRTSEAPRWEIPFPLPSVLASFMGQDSIMLVIDLAFLEDIMPFVRMFILAGFVMMLAKATSSFIKW
ncbi:MAG: hypothetical protein FWG31_09835, partial [Oscillospiraceae bacterium]|nr:hypothetical protein [Oscillospiraceae bacterium]